MSPNSSVSDDFTVRPATEDDEPFLIRLYGTTREYEMNLAGFTPEMRDEFVRMQFDAQSYHYRTYFKGSVQNVIEVDGQPVGREYVYRSELEINVLDILLLPEYCGRGIGTKMLTKLLDESRETGIPVILYTEKTNERALRLYLRLGFKINADEDLHWGLKWVSTDSEEV